MRGWPSSIGRAIFLLDPPADIPSSIEYRVARLIPATRIANLPTKYDWPVTRVVNFTIPSFCVTGKLARYAAFVLNI
jgi:hypothetical protein